MLCDTTNQIRTLLSSGNYKAAIDELLHLRRNYLGAGWMDDALRKSMYHILHMIDGKDELKLALKELDEFDRLYKSRHY